MDDLGGIDISLVVLPAWDVVQPAHGLAVVAAIARDAGVSFRAHDLNIAFYKHVLPEERSAWRSDRINVWTVSAGPALWEKYRDWLEAELDRVLADGPRILGFSVNIWTRAYSENAAAYVRRTSPSTIIMFGGVDCFFGEYNKTFIETGICDIICQGEAETAFSKYLKDFSKTGNWKTQVPGFAYVDNGAIVDTGRVELPHLDDDLPTPAFECFDLTAYRLQGHLPFYFSRGCPYSCRFCSETVNFSQFRCRDPQRAFNELRHSAELARQFSDTPFINLSDSIFNANVKKLEALANIIIESGVRFQWAGQGHFHASFSTALINKLREAGLDGIFWGFESGSQKVVDLMKKSFQIEEARRIITECSEAGIAQSLPILLGFPGEKPEDVVETIAFITEFGRLPRVRFFQPSPVLVRPNAELYDRYEQFGLSNRSLTDWTTVDGSNTPATRSFRVFVVSQVLSNPTLSAVSMAVPEALNDVYFNDPSVADEAFRLLSSIYRRAGVEDRFFDYVERLAQHSGVSGAEQQWRAIEKNGWLIRQIICEIVLQGLRTLREPFVPDGPGGNSPAGHAYVERLAQVGGEYLGVMAQLRATDKALGEAQRLAIGRMAENEALGRQLAATERTLEAERASFFVPIR